jgi:hypothetical protein
MRRALTVVLAMMLLVPTSAAAHEETLFAFFIADLFPVIEEIESWEPLTADSVPGVRDQVADTWIDLQALLLTTTPEVCYRQLYAATWRINTDLWHLWTPDGDEVAVIAQLRDDLGLFGKELDDLVC